MYDSSQGMKGLRTISEFDINKHANALRVYNPIEDVRIGADTSYSENVTYISKKTIVDGNINSSGPISVSGTVNGDIDTTSDLGVNGIITGDITADSINYAHAAVRGNAKAVKDVNVSEEAVIIGNIDAGKLVVAGKVKGEIVADRNILFKSTALMVGSVTASGMNMEDGSRINAAISIVNKNQDAYDEDEFEMGV